MNNDLILVKRLCQLSEFIKTTEFFLNWLSYEETYSLKPSTELPSNRGWMCGNCGDVKNNVPPVELGKKEA
jgi:hypothetical protein